jgi:hypothetical protein
MGCNPTGTVSLDISSRKHGGRGIATLARQKPCVPAPCRPVAPPGQPPSVARTLAHVSAARPVQPPSVVRIPGLGHGSRHSSGTAQRLTLGNPGDIIDRERTESTSPRGYLASSPSAPRGLLLQSSRRPGRPPSVVRTLAPSHVAPGQPPSVVRIRTPAPASSLLPDGLRQLSEPPSSTPPSRASSEFLGLATAPSSRPATVSCGPPSSVARRPGRPPSVVRILSRVHAPVARLWTSVRRVSATGRVLPA